MHEARELRCLVGKTIDCNGDRLARPQGLTARKPAAQQTNVRILIEIPWNIVLTTFFS